MFNKSRLTVARQRRLFTKTELAFRVGLEPRSISGFEAGQYTPSDETIEKLARALEYPKEYFDGADLDIPGEDSVSFRSMSKMTAKRRNAAVAAGAIAFSLSDWVDSKFSMPVPDLLDLRDDSPELAALSLRQYWGLGHAPIKNMVHTLEAKGVRVFSLAEDCKEVDAYSLWRNDRPFVFLNTYKSAERRRMDAAHELGHLVLHKHAAPNGIVAEKEANAFAGAFLMPTASMKALGRVEPSIESVLRIKKHWTVSAFAAVVRLHEIGVLSDWHYTALCMEMQRRGWRSTEPLSARVETSQIWQKAFPLLRDKNIGVQELASQLAIPADEIIKLVFGLVTIGIPSTASGPTLPRKQKPELRLVPGKVAKPG